MPTWCVYARPGENARHWSESLHISLIPCRIPQHIKSLTVSVAFYRVNPQEVSIPWVSADFGNEWIIFELSLLVIEESACGTQYLSIHHMERLAEAGIESSVGSVGDSYENALAETIIGLYKTEVIRRRRPWRQIDAVEYATLECVDWFNVCRLLEPFGNVTPAEFEQAFYKLHEARAVAA